MGFLRARLAFIPPVVLLLASVAGTAAMRDTALPARGFVPSLAVAFPPWWTGGAAARAVATAGGSVLAIGPWPFALLATGPDAGFSARLRTAGAWWVAGAGTGGCTPMQGRGR